MGDGGWGWHRGGKWWVVGMGGEMSGGMVRLYVGRVVVAKESE